MRIERGAGKRGTARVSLGRAAERTLCAGSGGLSLALDRRDGSSWDSSRRSGAALESGIGNREPKIENREPKIGNREPKIGNRESGIWNLELDLEAHSYVRRHSQGMMDKR